MGFEEPGYAELIRDEWSRLSTSWASASRNPLEYVEFFQSHAAKDNQTDFISFGEITDGRATSMDAWSPNLREVLIQEISAALSPQKPADGYMRIFEARKDGELVAYALLSFHPNAETPHAWLQDVVVHSDHRGTGIGSELVAAIEGDLRSAGDIKYIFLESSVKKPRAHHFFGLHGYEPSAVVMLKDLKPLRSPKPR